MKLSGVIAYYHLLACFACQRRLICGHNIEIITDNTLSPGGEGGVRGIDASGCYPAGPDR